MSKNTIIFYTTHTDNDNLQFFLKHGLEYFKKESKDDKESKNDKESKDSKDSKEGRDNEGEEKKDKVKLVFIFNGDFEVKNLTDSEIKNDNIVIRRRPNQGLDFGAWSYGLQKETLENWDYFIFINSTVCGPMFPKWTPPILREKWWTIFTDKITSDTKLVGTTINVHQQLYSYSHTELGFSKPHVQSMLLATDAVGLKIAMENKVFDLITDNLDKQQLIDEREVGLSLHMLKAGYNIACLLSAYANVDFRLAVKDVTLTNKIVANTKYSGDVLFADSYFDINIHPYEVVFFKTTRDITPSVVERLKRWN